MKHRNDSIIPDDTDVHTKASSLRKRSASAGSRRRVYSAGERRLSRVMSKRGSTLLIVLLTMTVLITVVSAAYFITRNYGHNVTVKENHIVSARNAEQICDAVVQMFSEIPADSSSVGDKSDLLKLIIQGVDYAAYMTNRYNGDRTSEINPYPDKTREAGGKYNSSYLILKTNGTPDLQAGDPPTDKKLEDLKTEPLVISGYLSVPPSVQGSEYNPQFDLKYDIKVTYRWEKAKDSKGVELLGETGYAVFGVAAECTYKGNESTAAREFKLKKLPRFEGYRYGLTATGLLGDKIDGKDYIRYVDGKLIADTNPSAGGIETITDTNSKAFVDKGREYFPWTLKAGSNYAPPPFNLEDVNLNINPRTWQPLTFFPAGATTPWPHGSGDNRSGGSGYGDEYNSHSRWHITTDFWQFTFSNSFNDIYKLGDRTTPDANSNLMETITGWAERTVDNPYYEPAVDGLKTYGAPVRIPFSSTLYLENRRTTPIDYRDLYFVVSIAEDGEVVGNRYDKFSRAGNPATAASINPSESVIYVFVETGGTVNYVTDSPLNIPYTPYGFSEDGEPLSETDTRTRYWVDFERAGKVYETGSYTTAGSKTAVGESTVTAWLPTATNTYGTSPGAFNNCSFYGESDVRKSTSGPNAQNLKDGFTIVTGSVLAKNGWNGVDNAYLTTTKFNYSSLPVRSDAYGTNDSQNIDAITYNIEYKIPSEGTALNTSYYFYVDYDETVEGVTTSKSQKVDDDVWFKGGDNIRGKQNVAYKFGTNASNAQKVRLNDMVKINKGTDADPVYEYYIRTPYDRKVAGQGSAAIYRSNGSNGFVVVQNNNSSVVGLPLADPTYRETVYDGMNPSVDSFGFPLRLPRYQMGGVLFLRYIPGGRYIENGITYGGINLVEPADGTFEAGKRYFVLIDTLNDPAGITYINLKDRNGDGVFNWFGNQGGTEIASSDDPSKAAQIVVLYTGEGEVVFNCDDGYQAEPNMSFMYYASMDDIWQRAGINTIRPTTWLAASWAGVGTEPWVKNSANNAKLVPLGRDSAVSGGTAGEVVNPRPLTNLLSSPSEWSKYWNPNWADVLAWCGNNIHFVTNKAAPGTPDFIEGRETAKISFDPALDYAGRPRNWNTDTYWDDVDTAHEGKEAVASAQFINGFIYMPNYIFRYAERPGLTSSTAEGKESKIQKFKYGNTVLMGGIVAAAFDIGNNNNFFYATPGSYVAADLTDWGGRTDEWSELRADVQGATDGVITKTVAKQAKPNSSTWFQPVSNTFRVAIGISSTGVYELDPTPIRMDERILVRSLWIDLKNKSMIGKNNDATSWGNGPQYALKKINGNKVLRFLIFKEIEQIPKKDSQGVMTVF